MNSSMTFTAPTQTLAVKQNLNVDTSRKWHNLTSLCRQEEKTHVNITGTMTTHTDVSKTHNNRTILVSIETGNITAV